MTWTSGLTFTTNEVVTAAKMNQLKDNVEHVANFHGWRAYRAAALSHTSTGNEQAIATETDDFDTDAFHNTADGKATIPTGFGGKYLLVCGAEFAANSTGLRGVRMRKGATPTDLMVLHRVNNLGAGTVTPSIHTAIVQLSAADFVQAWGYQNSGGNLAYGVGQNTTYHSGTWLGF